MQKWRRCLWCSVFILAAHAQAGELFDDYLNYVRPGTGTGPGDGEVRVTAEHPVGQTFKVSANTGEIYRIGVRPMYDTWQPGEQVTLRLFESPRRKTEMASYTIDHGTSFIQAIHDTKDRVLWFQLRAPTDKRTALYFELSTTGGDGEVRFEGIAGGDYAPGKIFGHRPSGDAPADGKDANPPAKDIAFECHIKPVADREANLRRFFSERLNIDHPNLKAVKKAVEREDWEQAIAETVNVFHHKWDVWGSWESVMEVSVNPEYDATHEDMILKGFLRHREHKEYLQRKAELEKAIAEATETGDEKVLEKAIKQLDELPVIPEYVPWRKESYWVPEYTTIRKNPDHATEPQLYWWHMGRHLAGAYTGTGKAKYARGAIDLRMQFILDNPNPKTSGLPQYFQLWNDRTASARAPGHGNLVYARLYNFPEFTTDERMVFFCFLEENARWTYQATSRANWGAEAARGCYSFGLKFPEWSMSPEYVRWGVARLGQIVMRSVRGDGTSSESAVKYHAMVARRLLGMLEDCVEHDIPLDDDTRKELTGTVEAMYEHMAYVLMPNSFVVMCGDSWYENYANKMTFDDDDILEPKRFLLTLKEGRHPVAACLYALLEDKTRDLLDAYDGSAEPDSELLNAVVGDIQQLIRDESEEELAKRREEGKPDKKPLLCDESAYADVDIRPRARAMIELEPGGAELEHLRRMLLEDSFPGQISSSLETGELARAGRIVNRPDFVWIATQGKKGTPPSNVSTMFPEGGYFIMRDHFGTQGRNYWDAIQLFVHNGMWFGSHCHWDLTAINLYAYGRVLIIDPGQYEWEPPPGISKYHKSMVHSMVAYEDNDVERTPGPNTWISNAVFDWLDAEHHGYADLANTGDVRRRILFVKPHYFIVDDSVETFRDGGWWQIWNLTDPNATVDPATKRIDTTFTGGGNLMILSQDPGGITVEEAPGITAAGRAYPDTKIIRFKRDAGQPRYQSLLYPYPGTEAPPVEWKRYWPEDRPGADDHYFSLVVKRPQTLDWIAMGHVGQPALYNDGKHRVDADLAIVHMVKDDSLPGFGWVMGRELTFANQTLATADNPVYNLAVQEAGDKLMVEASFPEHSLAIHVGHATAFVLNGLPVTDPVVRNGMYYPFADAPRAIIADDREDFEQITATTEWGTLGDPNAYNGTYRHHETDVGRHETGDYVFHVPAAGRYRVEVFLPDITKWASEAVEYAVPLATEKNTADGDVEELTTHHIVTLDQRTRAGWVPIGTFDFEAGELRINARNVTPTDGQYLIIDAMRLIPMK